MHKIISDRQVLHHSNTRGIVITRVQIVEIDGQRFEARYWTNFSTGTLHHIDTVPVN